MDNKQLHLGYGFIIFPRVSVSSTHPLYYTFFIPLKTMDPKMNKNPTLPAKDITILSVSPH